MSILTFLRSIICPEPVQPVERPFTTLCPISGSHIRGILSTAFPDAQIRIADRDYSAPTLAEFNQWIRNNYVSEHKYYAEYFDCDDSARAVRCAMFKVGRDYKTTVSMAYVEGRSPGGYHAFCIFIDNDDNIFIVEPQTDGVVIADKSLYEPDFIQL